VFNYTGGQQTFVVPAGVKTLGVFALGASGGLAGNSNVGGGDGVAAESSIPVRPHQTLYVEVGGRGSNSNALPCSGPPMCMIAPGGFNGGGTGGSGIGGGQSGAGGGGASDVQTLPASGGTAVLTSRLLVAAGGGGAGGSGQLASVIGGPGGDGGAAGKAGASGTPGVALGGGPGVAASASAGGGGGAAGASSVTGSFYLPGNAGPTGVLGIGATGGGGAQLLPCVGCGAIMDSGGGGGGGGGLFGGGAGGGGGINECDMTPSGCIPDGSGGGGGGGGSSYAPHGRVFTPYSNYLTPEDGQVVISWDVGVPDASFPGETLYVASPTQSPAAGSTPGAPLSVTVPVFCVKAAGRTCSIALTLSAGQGRHKTAIGTASINLPAGGYTTATINLNAAGVRLARARHTLKASLFVGKRPGATKKTVGKVVIKAP
jgi:hypothetical protein